MAEEQDLSEQLHAMRPTLLRLAQLQLRNQAWAEDAVSETLLAALEGAGRFGHNSKLQTWVVGILKHKVLDQLRLRRRECEYEAADDEPDGLEERIYAPDGHFREAPQHWESPVESLQRLQFFQVLEACMDALPGRLGRVFLMREWLELDSEAICQELSITSTNLWQMLSRARLRLRQCLQVHWFAEKTS
ncbi:MAG: sigma-70 family RNA polymerase sigma factor [Betaproteobacteria bacterium]|nr:sigma-70 family RNA polymerase sigma factor [Betaproteobacteria bacterium]